MRNITVLMAVFFVFGILGCNPPVENHYYCCDSGPCDVGSSPDVGNDAGSNPDVGEDSGSTADEVNCCVEGAVPICQTYTSSEQCADKGGTLYSGSCNDPNVEERCKDLINQQEGVACCMEDASPLCQSFQSEEQCADNGGVLWSGGNCNDPGAEDRCKIILNQ